MQKRPGKHTHTLRQYAGKPRAKNEQEREQDYASEKYDKLYGDSDNDYYDGHDSGSDTDNFSEDFSDNDIYGDYAVKPRFAPYTRQSHHRNHVKHKQAQRNSNPQFASSKNATKPSHFLLPTEVLHLIFAYVDYSTVHKSLVLVSRLFHAIAKDYLELRGMWTLGTQQQEDELLAKIQAGSVNALRIRYQKSSAKTVGRIKPYDRWNWALKRFVDKIMVPFGQETAADTVGCTITDASSSSTDPECEVQEEVELEDIVSSSIAASTLLLTTNTHDKIRLQPCLFRRVKKLTIDSPALDAFLPYLHRIHTLDLLFKELVYDFPLLPILHACDNLDTLILQGVDPEKASFCWRNNDMRTASSTDNKKTAGMSAFEFSQLKSVTISNLSFMHSDLEQLLKHCPTLTSFKAGLVRILRGEGENQWTSPPIEWLYRRAWMICPTLSDFSLSPANPDNNDTFDLQVDLTAKYFPNTKHLDVVLPLMIEEDGSNSHDGNWSPTPEMLLYLETVVTSLTFVGHDHSPRDLDRILKYTRAVTRVSAPNIKYTRPEPITELDLAETVARALKARERRLLAIRVKRGHAVDRYRRFNVYVQLRGVLTTKQARLQNRIVRQYHLEQRQQIPSRSWRCPNLRFLELQISDRTTHNGRGGGCGHGKSCVSPQAQTRVLRFLARACPNLEILHLQVCALWAGQEEKVVTKFQKPYTEMATYSLYGKTWNHLVTRYHDKRRTCWKDTQNAMKELGPLSKLQRLTIEAGEVPGVLHFSAWQFLRLITPATVAGATETATAVNGTTTVVSKEKMDFCPRLELMRISSETRMVFRRSKGIKEERQVEDRDGDGGHIEHGEGAGTADSMMKTKFVNLIKTIRPGTQIFLG
ncbi:hypothetical protein BG004_002240 [Podila humilis]|nr:hypothetical protein BG004_002240 [Podila humilis]